MYILYNITYIACKAIIHCRKKILYVNYFMYCDKTIIYYCMQQYIYCKQSITCVSCKTNHYIAGKTYVCCIVRKRANIRNRYNQVPHITLDTFRESDKNTRKHHTQKSQEVSPFSTGVHKAARNRQDSITKTT